MSVFTHISTAYVNCNRSGFIEEKIYNNYEDADSIVNHIMQKDVKELEENLKSYIGSYPNTYTFTKSLAEKQLVKTKDHVNVVIWRPSIIGSGLQDPFPGWTDTLSAAGGLALLSALGLVQFIHV